MSQPSFKYQLGKLNQKAQEVMTDWQQNDKVQRLWTGDNKLWTGKDEASWTGWLTIPAVEMSQIPAIQALSNHLKSTGITDIILLGMGGSSLCPAMMAAIFGRIAGYPKLHVLDSTSPEQILKIEKSVSLKTTFFIVSSKSGSTLEPNIFQAYFFTRLQEVLGTKDVGHRFAAITDPDTKMEEIAKQDKFHAIFYGMPSIGGRYSALSNFGMVPAGLMGVNITSFLEKAHSMAHACAVTPKVGDNPGAMLGVILGVCANNGKDKLTLIISPAIQAFGAWAEQLIAESTGKMGKGIIPIDLETIGLPNVYGDDRVFVYLRLQSAPDAEQDRKIAELENAGQVVIYINLESKEDLAGEIFRWELATATAGSIIQINPFNQPDVEASKVRAKELTTEYETTGKIFSFATLAEANGIALSTDAANAADLKKYLRGNPTVENYLRAHFARINAGDYVDFAAFIEMSPEYLELLQKSRHLVRDSKKAATCLGFGPRFLHSTGQAYKGGPNTGVFLQITTDYSQDIPVPEHRYTFGLVQTAQALSDFEVLAKRSRRALRIHLANDMKNGLVKLHEIIKQALTD